MQIKLVAVVVMRISSKTVRTDVLHCCRFEVNGKEMYIDFKHTLVLLFY